MLAKLCLQVAGTVAADTLQLGNITVQNQGFGLVLSSSSDFVDISCDGLFVSPSAFCSSLKLFHLPVPCSSIATQYEFCLVNSSVSAGNIVSVRVQEAYSARYQTSKRLWCLVCN